MIAEWGNFLTHFMRFSRRNADWHLYEWLLRWWPPALFSRLINTCTPCGSPMRPCWTSHSSFGGKWWKDWAGTQTPRLPWRCCRPLCVRSLTAQVGASEPLCYHGYMYFLMTKSEKNKKCRMDGCHCISDIPWTWTLVQIKEPKSFFLVYVLWHFKQ